MSPLYRSDTLGIGERLTVSPGHTALIGTSVMTIEIAGEDASTQLDRLDVERLRDLCDEALS